MTSSTLNCITSTLTTVGPVQTSSLTAIEIDQSSALTTVEPVLTSFLSTTEIGQEIQFTSSSRQQDSGPNGNIFSSLCDMLQPCQNHGNCTSNNTIPQDFFCSCSLNFTGERCEVDNRPCKADTCWNNGACEEILETDFYCHCVSGWEGKHCERKENYCLNITCHNGGVCRPLFRNYTCNCLGNHLYSGRHCEIKSKRLIILNIVSTSCGYIGIIAISVVAMFVIIMDVLKYCFGVDPTREDLEEIRRKKRAKKRTRIAVRFIYVNAAPPLEPSEGPCSKTNTTTV